MSLTYFAKLRNQHKVKVKSYSRSASKEEIPEGVARVVIGEYEDRGQKLQRVLYIENEIYLVADVIEKVKAAPEKKEEVKPKATRKPIVKSTAKPKPKPKTTRKKPTQAKPKEDNDGDKDVASQ